MYVYYNAYTFHTITYVGGTYVINLSYIDILAKCKSDFNFNN